MDEAVILSACRTAIGKYGKALTGIKSTELGAHCIKEAVKRAGIEAADVEECIMGTSCRQDSDRTPPGRQPSAQDSPSRSDLSQSTPSAVPP